MSKSLPKYRRHPNGQAFVQHKSIPTPDNRMYLGLYGTEDSHARYRQFLNRLAALAPGEKKMALPRKPDAPLAEIVRVYQEAIQPTHSRGEYLQIRSVLFALCELYGLEPAARLGPSWLTRLQGAMVKKDFARTHINAQVGRVKRFVAWCCREELMPAATFAELTCVKGLMKGRSPARETAKIKPVAWVVVELTLPFLPPVVGDMLRVQYLCGMRPQDVCALTAAVIDRSHSIWLCRLEEHKGAWRGDVLVKAIPTEAQAILLPRIEQHPDGALFRPLEAFEWSKEYRRRTAATRKTPLYPSEVKRIEREKRAAAKRRGRVTLEFFDTSGYDKAIRAGLERATAAKVEIPKWTPNQLRHEIGTEISQTLGRQAAQMWLGHKQLSTTGIYAEHQVKELLDVAQRLEAAKENGSAAPGKSHRHTRF